jgi:cellulose synthase/poly-beta-1,6-N-acetylglucosamine synthase-like glycosyltransferase
MMSLFTWIVSLLLVLYALLLVAYRFWFGRLRTITLDAFATTITRFSIIIPARNEQDNIANCIKSIAQQSYPTDLYEIIVIDDFSEDNTALIVQGLQAQFSNLRLLQLKDYYKPHELNAYKKKAIEKAVGQATGDWIVTTDADCIVPKNWLALYDQYIVKHQPVFVAAPVMFIKTNGFLNQFQILDFMALQGITAAAVGAGKHSMSNGANLAFEKAAFFAVGGYQGVDNIASGDDMLLMHKMKQLSKPIGYIFSQEAIVQTKAMENWRDFIMQRIRWSSKARFYDDRSIFWVLLLVYVLNASFIGLVLFGMWKLFWVALILKTLFELIFMVPVAKFFHKEAEIPYFPMHQPFHILYTIVAGFLGQIKTYTWKGRKLK